MSDELAEKLRRVEHCKGLIRDYRPLDYILKDLVNTFKINRNQAYNYYFDCLTLFDERRIRLEKLLENLQKSQTLALSKGDSKAFAITVGNEAKIVKEFFKEETQADINDLTPPEVEIGFFPELLPQMEHLSQAKIDRFIEQVMEEFEDFEVLDDNDLLLAQHNEQEELD